MMQSQLGEYHLSGGDDLEMGHHANIVGGPSPPTSSGRASDEDVKKGGALGGIVQTRVIEMTETDEENLIRRL